MPVKRRLLFLFLVLYSGFAAGQRIGFFKEELVFTLDSISFSLNGDYYFRNPSASAVDYTIFYPVSRTPGYAAIDTIVVYDVSKPGQPLLVEIKDSIASFSLSFLPLEKKCVKIYYRQRHNGASARYILMTTHNWHQPLELAKYSLVTVKNTTVSHFSIPPDQSEDFGETRIFYWTRKQFMPETDFVFELHNQKAK
jgi:hypothetical protein